MPNTDDMQIENLLSAVTDALLAENSNLDAISRQYQVPRSEVDSFVRVINRLHLVLVGVQPSRRFVRRLKQDLIGVPNRNVFSRVRHLPPRVQIAAGIALVAGFMFLSRRRMIHDVHRESQEIISA
jgi:hypothetical protein